MGIGTSIFLFAVGAIMRFAVNVDTNGTFDIHMVGNILMLVGALGAVLSLLFWSSWGGFGRDGVGGGRDTYVDARDTPRDTVVVERERPRRTVIERETRI